MLGGDWLVPALSVVAIVPTALLIATVAEALRRKGRVNHQSFMALISSSMGLGLCANYAEIGHGEWKLVYVVAIALGMMALAFTGWIYRHAALPSTKSDSSTALSSRSRSS